MMQIRLAALAVATVALSGCLTSLPTPDYTVKTPAAYRVSPEGARVDNENITLDAEGYRIDSKGERIGVIDVPAKTAGEQSNAVAGFYISSTGATAPGKVASASEGMPAGTLPPMSGGAGMPTPANAVTTPIPSPAGAPPLAPVQITPSPATTAITSPPTSAPATPAPTPPGTTTTAPKTTPPATGAPVPLSR